MIEVRARMALLVELFMGLLLLSWVIAPFFWAVTSYGSSEAWLFEALFGFVWSAGLIVAWYVIMRIGFWRYVWRTMADLAEVVGIPGRGGS